MRIALVGDTRYIASPDGWHFTAGNSRRSLLVPYAERFEEVVVVMRVRPGRPDELAAVPASERIDLPKVRFVPLPPFRGPLGFLECRRRVRRLLAEALRGVDACIARVPSQAGDMSVNVARSLGVPVYAHVMGDPVASWADSDQYVRLAPLRHCMAAFYRGRFRRMLSRCAGIFSVSHSVVADYLPPGADVHIVADTCLEAEDFMAYRPYDGLGPFTLLFVGRLVDIKNVELVLRGLAAAVAQGVDCVVRLAGDGPHRSHLEALATELGLGERVTFLGQVVDRGAVRDEYRRAHAGFLVSRTEGLPLGAIEGMASSLPTILSDIPPCHEVAGEERAALFVGVDDVPACAEAIRRLVEDAQLRERLARSAFRRAQVFRSDYQVEQLRRHLEAAVGA